MIYTIHIILIFAFISLSIAFMLLRKKKYRCLIFHLLLTFAIVFGAYRIDLYYSSLFPPSAHPDSITIEEGRSLSDEEIVRQIIIKQMEYNKQKPFFINGSIMDYKDIRVYRLHGEPDIFGVVYSVRSMDEAWQAGNGKTADDYWTLDKSQYFRLVKKDRVYKLIVIGTGL